MMPPRATVLRVLLALGGLLVSGPAVPDSPRAEGTPSGPARYVSLRGSDEGPGTAGSPWRTLRHAISRLGPGDTLYIRAGTWTEDAWSRGWLPSGKGESSRVTFAAYPGEVVVLRPVSSRPGALYLVGKRNQYITFKGLVWDGSGLTGRSARNVVRFDPTRNGALDMPHHIRFAGGEVRFGRSTSCFQVATHDSEFLDLDVHHCGCTDNHDHAYYLSGHRNLIRGGKVHDNVQAIQIWNEHCERAGAPCSGTPGANTIDGVEFYNDGLNPWCMSSPLPASMDLGVIGVFQRVMGSGTTITNCNIHDNRLSGIRVGEYAARPQNVTISNNRIVNNGSRGGTGIYFLGPSSGSRISGNVLSGNPATGNHGPGNQIHVSGGGVTLSDNTQGP